MNNLNLNSSGNKECLDRSFREVEGGYWDGKGFYCTPEGSFWDEHGVYFNREGVDRHGGFYDEYTIYNPGPGWIEEFACYEDDMNIELEDEIKKEISDKFNEELIHGFHDHEKYYYENDEDLDEDFYNSKDAQIFNQYIENNSSNIQSTGNQIGNSLHQNNENYDKSNQNSNNYKHSLETSAGKNNIGSSDTKANRFNENNSLYE